MVFREVTGATAYILRAESGDILTETMVTSSPGTVLNLNPYTEYTINVIGR